MSPPELVVCSHRGPYVFREKAGGFVASRGGGGLIGAVAPLVERTGATWIAAALGVGDRALARSIPEGREQDGFLLKLLDLPPDDHELHYNVVANTYLWFLFHYLFDVPIQPSFDQGFGRAWEAYRRVNERFAEGILAAPRSDAVIVHDYHLMLVGRMLRERSRARRPVLYFHHTPWCDPEYFSLLPESLGSEVLRAMLAYDVVGFHARRWADAFAACCRRFLGARTDDDRVVLGRRSTRVVVAPVPLDTRRLGAELDDQRVAAWAAQHDDVRAGRKTLLRVDRIDLSKNPLRGFLAFEELLERRPKLARDVVFLALLYPSRLTVERYRRYYADCLGVVRRINERFEKHVEAEQGPVILHFQDDYYRSLGAMRTFDSLLVNPVFDGLNLVSKEGAFANQRAGSVILSRNAGAFEEIGRACIPVNPFDVSGTADAIEESLEMPLRERRPRAERLGKLAGRGTPLRWARAQLEAAGLNV